MSRQTFAVVRVDDLRELSGLAPMVTVAAEGDTPVAVARSLEAAARYLRNEWRAVLKLPKPRRLRVVQGGRRGRV